tara:strand:- start:3255 stop:4193 length:939 start_codon:yes stop_codon:yes gene_type:complete
MSKLKGLLLTEGMHGMISQVEGLAKALDLDYFHEKIELTNFWKIIPPKFTPISRVVFKNKINMDYDVIISCGRKSVIPSIYLKRNINKKIINIHIQDPKVALNHFNYVVVPEHDSIDGDNVIKTKGAIHYLTIEDIDKNRSYLENKVNSHKEILTLILGGPTKYYKYTEKNLENIFYKIKKNIENNNLQLIVLSSIRTPQNAISLAKNYFSPDSLIIEEVDKKAYLSSLSLSKFIVVTCDSSSMISEAALTGKPIYIAQIPAVKNDYRFKKFRGLFKELNIIRELNDKLENWNYEKLNETIRIAEEIKKKIS